MSKKNSKKLLTKDPKHVEFRQISVFKIHSQIRKF